MPMSKKKLEELFIQTNYRELDLNLSKYGCNVLTLCEVSQSEFKPVIELKTQEDVLSFVKTLKKKGLVDNEYFVNDAPSILKELTGLSFRQLTAPAAFGIGGATTYIPIHYPVPNDTIQIACYRKKENFKQTHFSRIKTKQGNTFSSINVFNTLGNEWLESKAGDWFASDKRVYQLI